MKITFEGHQGFLYIDTGQAEFYGVIFHNMIQARDYLKNLCPGQYIGIYDEDYGVRLIQI
jgi:hypothetical protein